MDEIIKHVARELGWLDDQFGPDVPPMVLSPVAAASFFIHEIVDEMLHDFTAYAKAEMAKRGWFIIPYYGGSAPACCWGTNGSTGTQNYKYDPTDPISEAWAVLRCIHEILSSTEPNANDRPQA